MSSQAMRYLQLENTRLKADYETCQHQIEALHHYVTVLADLYMASQTIATADGPLHELDQLLLKVVQVSGAKDGSVLLLDQSGKELIFTLVHGELRQQLPGHRIPNDTGVAGWALSNDQPVIVNTPRQDWRFSFSVDQEFAFLTRSILCIPIKFAGNMIGVTELINKDPQGFSETDLTLLSVFAHIVASTLGQIDFYPMLPQAPEPPEDNFLSELL